jgi:transposase IS4-like protein
MNNNKICHYIIYYYRWSDRREVVMLNSFMPHGMQDVQTRNPNNARMKPLSVLEYNKTMGGVDNVDRTIKPYHSSRKSFKWYKIVFFYLIDISLYNSHVLHSELRSTRERLPFKTFLLEFVRKIVNQHPSIPKLMGRPSQIPVAERLTGTHLPEKVMKNGSSVFSDCHYCKLRGIRKGTSFRCKKCLKRFCIDSDKNCFYLYHSTRQLPSNVNITLYFYQLLFNYFCLY